MGLGQQQAIKKAGGGRARVGEQHYTQCHHCWSDLPPRSTEQLFPISPKIFAPNCAENLKGLQMPCKYIQTLQPVADFSHAANSL